MSSNKIYFAAKPFVPTALRHAVRRQLARRIRQRVSNVWPIFPGSARPPISWPGWPHGKKFAVVLTHDVESPHGLVRCRPLIELEMELGFRSSFNFIPEGDYEAPSQLLSDLACNGFEVGIHDLHHDGKLYTNRSTFKRKATQINEYLKQWNAVGFRSGFMLHNLSWLHDLNIQYDASTFDTDPFEPQPDGQETIFPFWVPHPVADQELRVKDDVCANGYVELPYTLPQDSTLFLLLRERTPDIWLRKVDWIAQHGGMVLVNAHPDYMAFANELHLKRAYPVMHYWRLLEHLREHYGSSFWQPLPREMAAFVSGLKHRPTNLRPRRVAMITHSIYVSDNRVRRYAEALATRGDHVDVFSLRRNEKQSRQEHIDGVNLFCIQDRFEKKEHSKLAYLLPLLRFLFVASFRLTRRHLQEPYDVVHVHNIPDFLVFSAWYPKLTRVPVILDIHDIVPEFFVSKFRVHAAGITNAVLRWMERGSAAFADHIIIANHLWLGKYAQRTGSNERCSVLVNHVDSNIFKRCSEKRRDGKRIILYPGGLQWHQGLDIAIRAFKQVSDQLPMTEFHIYGDGSAKESLVKLAARLKLNGRVRFFEPRTVHEIATIMANADLGVVPKRADSFGNEAYSTKIMEFMAVGVPVVVSDTKVDRFYFDESVVRFFRSGDADDLARQMLEILHNGELSKAMVARAVGYATRNCWENRKDDYLYMVDSLCLNR
jgi:glycosyltransferase involved in cell wall biosynthesis